MDLTELQRIAKLLRLCKETDACVQLVRFLDEAQAAIDNRMPDKSKDHRAAIHYLLECQTRKDWLALADALEYELPEFYQSLGVFDDDNVS